MPASITFKYKFIYLSIEAPNKCPLCHHSVIIKEYIASLEKEDGVQLVFRCPNDDCNNFFIGYYFDIQGQILFAKYEPKGFVIKPFSEIISQVSKTFIDIYKEAEIANQIGLSQIAGPGFRKAVEFLIKDYAKYKSNPELVAEIEELFVGQVVNKFIPDVRIQSVAKRALWLGNDETHYLRKWKEKDITDLITLIELMTRWIEMEYLSSTYTEDMPD